MTENVQRLAIGEVAARARMSASRIRYYEKQGLLPEPERTSGRRRYSEEVFGRLAIVDAAQRVGFTWTRSVTCWGPGMRSHTSACASWLC